MQCRLVVTTGGYEGSGIELPSVGLFAIAQRQRRVVASTESYTAYPLRDKLIGSQYGADDSLGQVRKHGAGRVSGAPNKVNDGVDDHNAVQAMSGKRSGLKLP
jgi:hypothetical protein